MDQLGTAFLGKVPVLVCAGVLTAVLVFWRRLVDEISIRKFPLLGKDLSLAGRQQRYFASAFNVYSDGYHNLGNEFHRVTALDGDHIIIPNSYLDEMRQRPDDEIDVLKAFSKTLENDYIKLFPEKRKTNLVNGVVKKDLTRALARINPRLSDEVAATVREELPSSDEWTSVNLMGTLLRIVAIVSGNIFLGPENCRREEYLRSAIDYTIDIVNAASELKKRPSWTRPFFARVLPEFARLAKHRRDMRELLTPIVEHRRKLMRSGEPLPDDTLSWLLQDTEKAGVTDLADLTSMQLLLTMAAIHTTSLTASVLFYDLVNRPGVVEDLRREIRTVLEANDGVMSTRAMFDMKLMDSVMKESQRLSPTFIDGFRRYTLKPITLQDGTRIPSNHSIEAANGPVLMDGRLYPDPERFDAYRFHRLRTRADEPDPIGYRNREQYQYVSVSKENMSFGFGRHACPGRFFAANEIKLIVARVLLEYDFRMPFGGRGEEGEEGEEEETYKNFYVGVVGGADPTKELLFRKAHV